MFRMFGRLATGAFNVWIKASEKNLLMSPKGPISQWFLTSPIYEGLKIKGVNKDVNLIINGCAWVGSVLLKSFPMIIVLSRLWRMETFEEHVKLGIVCYIMVAVTRLLILNPAIGAPLFVYFGYKKFFKSRELPVQRVSERLTL